MLPCPLCLQPVALSRIPVILLTSLDDKEEVIKDLSPGADDYPCKSFEVL